MSRDKCGNRTQEVIGSIPFSSTTSNQCFSAARLRSITAATDYFARNRRCLQTPPPSPGINLYNVTAGLPS